MNDDPFGSCGLLPVALTDKPAFDRAFASCQPRLSDYTFSSVFIWRQLVHLRWRMLRGCLCVFANGQGGLTLLCPPLGEGNWRAAARDACGVCHDFNRLMGIDEAPRIEYVSDALLQRVGPGWRATPMSGDYVYPTARMIDLAGGDLAGKRHARSKFARVNAPRTERFEGHHREACLALLRRWQHQHDEGMGAGSPMVRVKRSKESSATVEAILNADALGLEGMVLYAGDRVAGFTFGERLAADTCCIVIEKADRDLPGSAQYIFSEFCRQFWADTAWCNVGDDWEVPTLAWTKQSYRPAFRIGKWTLVPEPALWVDLGAPVRPQPQQCAAGSLDAVETAPAGALPAEPAAMAAMPVVDRAAAADLRDLVDLETRIFDPAVSLKPRHMRYLMKSPSASIHVIREDGRVVAEAVTLRRRLPRGTTGRIYSLAVDPSRRGRGFGRLLLRNCLDTLRAEGAAAVTLEVEVGNTAARALYESEGFAPVGCLKDYYAPGRDAVKMRRALAEAVAAAGTV